MVAGADSIDDMRLLRHGGMGRLFGGVRAPSTLGTFLRTFTFGHVRQLDSVACRMLAEPAVGTPPLALAAASAGGRHRFEGDLVPPRTGAFGYTVRILPTPPGMANLAGLGLVANA